MPKIVHKDANSDHAERLKNLIKMTIQFAGKSGIDRKDLIDKLLAIGFNINEIQEQLNALIGKGEV
jgi:hypothetical protein